MYSSIIQSLQLFLLFAHGCTACMCHLLIVYACGYLQLNINYIIVAETVSLISHLLNNSLCMKCMSGILDNYEHLHATIGPLLPDHAAAR